ncbi:hypothetical protein NB311A_18683 [Nitrobacter sp. Nb-311A]|nr:hypothetical protein NB311A_18683 [Nitrobacter sp. Nb-311A]
MGDSQVSENDPTAYALAAIACFIDKPDVSDDGDAGAAPEPETPEQVTFEPTEETAIPDSPDPSPDWKQAETYTKYGPGPLAAVRFKWSTRCGDNGDYFVDETIGESSYPLVSGPMTKEAAIKFVDDRERDAQQRFEALRSEMAGETSQHAGE